jgi:hypothetical protein
MYCQKAPVRMVYCIQGQPWHIAQCSQQPQTPICHVDVNKTGKFIQDSHLVPVCEITRVNTVLVV